MTLPSPPVGSRGRVQRHPDYFRTTAAVVEHAGQLAKAVLPELKRFAPDIVVYQVSASTSWKPSD